jgi:hypothetical protein
MADLYTMMGTFMIAMSFNIKGLFKQRFYNQIYMTVSMMIYEFLIFYLLFVDDISAAFPWMEPVNEVIRQRFLVVKILT